MALEAIMAVKQAELAAEQRVREASERCKGILFNAEKEGKDLIDAMSREAKENARYRLERAKNEGEKRKAEAYQSSQRVIMMLQDLVEQRKEKAVEIVISALIS